MKNGEHVSQMKTDRFEHEARLSMDALARAANLIAGAHTVFRAHDIGQARKSLATATAVAHQGAESLGRAVAALQQRDPE